MQLPAAHDALTARLIERDAREPEGLDSALLRADSYLKAGADGIYIYIEAPKSKKELDQIGRAFKGDRKGQICSKGMMKRPG